MNNIRNFLRDLNSGNLEHKDIFPVFYDKSEKKKRICFVGPRMDEYGYFKMILPSFYLNMFSDFTCLTTNVGKNKRELDIEPVIANIDEEMIQLADIFVFSFSNQHLSPIFEEIRKDKPSIKIVFAIDFNFFDVPKSHNIYSQIQKTKKTIISNIEAADAVLIPSSEFEDYLDKKLKKKIKCIYYDPRMCKELDHQDIDFEKLPALAEEKKKIRIGTFTDLKRMEDFAEIKSVFDHILKNHSERVELIFYGYEPGSNVVYTEEHIEDGVLLKADRKPTPGRQPKNVHTRYKKADFHYFAKNLYNLALDLVILPYRDCPFNEYSGMDSNMAECFFLEIPVLTNRDMFGLASKMPLQVRNKPEDMIKYIDAFIEEYDWDNQNSFTCQQNAIINGMIWVNQMTQSPVFTEQIAEQYRSLLK